MKFLTAFGLGLSALLLVSASTCGAAADSRYTKSNRVTSQHSTIKRRRRFEDIVARAEELAGEKWERMVARRGDWWKWLVMSVARQYAGMTLAEIGKKSGGVDYAAVSVGLKRFEVRVAHDKIIKTANRELIKLLNVET